MIELEGVYYISYSHQIKSDHKFINSVMICQIIDMMDNHFF